jgi:tetratricopeptide (TPR) repeat protein
MDPDEEGPELYREVVKTYCDVSNNLATALFKLERWKEAKEVAVRVIELDPNNVKALYRGGMAALKQVRMCRYFTGSSTY